MTTKTPQPKPASEAAYRTFGTARLAARRHAPYLSAVLYGLVAREAPGLGTIGVTHTGVLLWDPEFAEACTAEELAFVLIHECMHVVLGHHARCVHQAKDPQLFNIAGDLSINPSVKAMGCTPPKGVERAGIFPKDFGLPEGLTAEEYYERLRKMADEAKKQGAQQPQAGAGFCGSCAGQKLPEPHENDDGSSGKDGEGEGRSQGKSPQQMERMRREVAEAVREQASKSQGTVPGDLVRWADTLLQPPRVPWQKKLAKVVRDAIAYRPGGVDLKFDGPSRKQAGLGFGANRPQMPRFRQPVPDVMVVLDTSGSMGTSELNDGMRELNGVLKATGAEATFVTCDAAVHGVNKVRTWKDAAKLLRGGGGSSFCPVFDEMRKMRRRPAIAIFITDGMIDVPTTAPPGTQIIWLVVGPYRKAPTEAYGLLIDLPPEDMKEALEHAAA